MVMGIENENTSSITGVQIDGTTDKVLELGGATAEKSGYKHWLLWAVQRLHRGSWRPQRRLARTQALHDFRLKDCLIGISG
jgi:hypothetical protein